MEITPTIVTVLGLAILLYGAYVAYRLRKMLGTGSIKEAWDRLYLLIILFIIGYIGFIAQLLSDSAYVDPKLIAATVFFFGGVFVAAVAYLNYDSLTG